jgi:hypothetical protein
MYSSTPKISEILCILWNPMFHYYVYNSPLLVPSWHELIQYKHSHLTSQTAILIFNSLLADVFQVVPFLQIFPPKLCIMSVLSYVSHATTLSSSFLWSLELHWQVVKNMMLLFMQVSPLPLTPSLSVTSRFRTLWCFHGCLTTKSPCTVNMRVVHWFN